MKKTPPPVTLAQLYAALGEQISRDPKTATMPLKVWLPGSRIRLRAALFMGPAEPGGSPRSDVQCVLIEGDVEDGSLLLAR